jgi:hypothetical protein
MNPRHATALTLVGLFGVLVICLIAVYPLYGRAQTPEDDWREVRPSAVPTKTGGGAQDSGTGTHDSDSPSLGTTIATGKISGLRGGGNPGDHLQFQMPYGTETYYFEGERRSDQISGIFESTPSGELGTWSTQVN